MNEKTQARLDALSGRDSHRQVMSRLLDTPSLNPRGELIETMARAAQKRLLSHWEDLDENEQREACEIAKGYLEGISLAGYQIALSWQPEETAPQDGTLILVCSRPSSQDAWDARFEQWRAPQTAAFRSFDTNAPGKTTWRDAAGRPINFSHWMPLLAPPIKNE